MFRFFFLLMSMLWLSACAQLPEWVPGAAFNGVTADTRKAGFSFDWELSGDPDIGPIQVFDNGYQTWLQFQPGQTLPAIFSENEQGQQPLRFRRQDDYVIIADIEPVLVFRGGQRQARAIRLTDASVATEASTPTLETLTDATKPASTEAFSDDVGNNEATPSARVSSAATLTSASFNRLSPPVAINFSLRYEDATLRHALQRWARQAGWTFLPEHWAVDVDIPVSAEADFGTMFEPAVQALLAATELSDRPVQPCFYSNRVVRVVPFTQACDRGRGDQS